MQGLQLTGYRRQYTRATTELEHLEEVANRLLRDDATLMQQKLEWQRQLLRLPMRLRLQCGSKCKELLESLPVTAQATQHCHESEIREGKHPKDDAQHPDEPPPPYAEPKNPSGPAETTSGSSSCNSNSSSSRGVDDAKRAEMEQDAGSEGYRQRQEKWNKMLQLLGTARTDEAYQPPGGWTRLYTEIARDYADAAVMGRGKVLHHPYCRQLYISQNTYASNTYVVPPSHARLKKYRYPAGRQGCCSRLWNNLPCI